MTNQIIHQFIKNNQADMIATRRYLHAHPEQSLQEFETTKYIAKQLDQLGLNYTLLNPTGLFGEIKGNKPGKTILLRADIDALSIQELNDVDYKSVNEGSMHACGHDAHAAMLLTAIKALLEVKDDIHGAVRFLFQPAEEIAKGARIVSEQGVLDGVDSVFGIHIWTVDEVGQISCQAGPSFASTDRFTIKFQGTGGHGGQPHMTHDAIIMASEYVSNVQNIISRVTDPQQPAVLTVGKFQAGDRWNIIAENAEIEGTVRTYDQETRDKIEDAMKVYADNIANMYGGTAEVDYERLIDPVFNEENAAKLVQATAAAAFGTSKIQDNVPTMGGEDFGYYLTKVPGAFATVGTRNPNKGSDYPHHSARFNIDEDSLAIGAELHAQYALAYLNQNEF